MTVEEKIRNRRIGVLGMARSGMGAAMQAKDLGGEPFVSDSARAELLVRQTRSLQAASIPFEVGGHTERLLECDYLVVSPGIPLDVPILKQARERGIPIFSEIEFASWICRGEIIAVTGSNGKTTTTTLLGQIFTEAGLDNQVCGNVGLPFSEVIRKIPTGGIAVVEVSTFQLETIADFRPHVALILNLTPDHLDRHGSFEAYKKLKYRVSENQTGEDYLILNADDSTIMGDAPESGATKLYFSAEESTDADAFVKDGDLMTRFKGQEQKIIKVTDILIPGPHNLQNAAAAACAAVVMGVEAATIAKVLRSFAGVEHRLEHAKKVAGIAFINDSKATNIDAVCYALRSVNTPLYLIAGGRDKGADFSRIIEFGKGKIRGVVALGEAKEKVFNILGKEFPVQMVGSMEEAVGRCFEMAYPGETVLLSPGCASFDMFKDYEHRGRVFKQAVESLRNGKNKNETISG